MRLSTIDVYAPSVEFRVILNEDKQKKNED